MARRFADIAVGGDVLFADLPEAAAPPGIVIRRGPMPEGDSVPIQQWPDGEGRTWLSIARAAGGYRVSLPGLECLVSADGRAIMFDEPQPLSTLVHLLLHQVLPLAVSRTGRLVLHACAVDTPAGTLAFLGESGAGKSTLAAAFCRRGFALVADDALAVDLRGAGIGVWPTADGLRLWEDMSEAAPAGIGEPSNAAGKRRAPAALATERSPLARVYLLATSEDDRAAVTDVPPATARIEMLSHLFRLDVTDREESRRLFDAVHRVASHVPARRVAYPDGVEFLDAAVDAVLADFA
ncbi:MAG TPA: hypothetical protein VMN81_10075 [Vicinamibacterales bacterium]|nr:hypothetical protein [Vicinamibacterales bacterium]